MKLLLCNCRQCRLLRQAVGHHVNTDLHTEEKRAAKTHVRQMLKAPKNQQALIDEELEPPTKIKGSFDA